MNKEIKNKIKKIIKEEKSEKRLKNGYYLKINLIISLAILALCLTFTFKTIIAFKSPTVSPKTTELVNLGVNFEKNDREIDARITCYNWTGNKMANGKYPELGYVATSDRTIPFGTIIEIEGVEYEVGDRTALWVHEKFEHPTVDIYMDDCSLDFGAKTKNIIIK